MSKLLLNMLKISILPAATMVVSKLLGLYIGSVVFGIDTFLTNEIQDIFSVQLNTLSRDDALTLNSVSNLTMLIVMTSINLYFFVKYTIFLRSQNNPKTVVKLTKLNLVKWVTDKENSFLKVFVWGMFLIASNAIVIASTLHGETYTWIGIAAFMITIFFVWVLIRSFEMEAAKVYPKKERAIYH